MSPLDLDLPDAVDAVPYSVRLAARRALLELEKHLPKPEERRAHARRTARELDWLESIRLTGGTGFGARLIDLSEGGALLEVDAPLRPGARLTLEINGRNVVATVPLEVLRCYIANLGATPLYRGACAFDRLIELPSAAPARPLTPNPALPTFVGIEAALLYLHARSHAMHPQEIVPVLDALRLRAAANGEEAGHLLTGILPLLRQSAPREEVVAILYERLRELPERVQPRMQETSARLLGLIDRCTSSAPGEAAAGAATETTVAAAPVERPGGGASAFQKLVVRYADGQLAKGFSQDFHPGRPQFSLWPSINARPSERVVVPVAKLKAVFFVKDFHGNPEYRERKAFTARGQGRRVEVTFLDTEVILGTTLNYRTDRQGFFVIPVDQAANNSRVFVVASAVKRVRLL